MAHGTGCVEPGAKARYVIPQNRICTFDREVQLNPPGRIRFNY